MDRIYGGDFCRKMCIRDRYKYQSVENILRELMSYYSEQNTEGMYIAESRKDNRVIGIFSPVSESNRTVFALTLGQILAESQNVLYLNMEECSGMGEYMGESHWNISDLIYFLRQQNNAQFLYRLNSMVQKLDHLDYIPPCASYTDFHQIETEEWLELIRLIRTRSSYDSVILDLGMAMGHETELLRQCDGIYAVSYTHLDVYKRQLFQFADFQITEVILKIVGRFFEDGKVKRMRLFCIGDAETLQIVGAVLFCPAGGMDFQIKNRADGIVEGGKRPECGSGFC